jgi:hypothetical protein
MAFRTVVSAGVLAVKKKLGDTQVGRLDFGLSSDEG